MPSLEEDTVSDRGNAGFACEDRGRQKSGEAASERLEMFEPQAGGCEGEDGPPSIPPEDEMN
ncbi:hypothetical protein HJFPF1_00687 [Paramyrothecium foliicola]|nr:hypothetical protein HJFPF1_00687 [Paramyrothecium foliicola]